MRFPNPTIDRNRLTPCGRVAALPSWQFVCERDWGRGPDAWWVGLFWDKDNHASEGECAYRKWWTVVLRFRFRLLIDKS